MMKKVWGLEYEEMFFDLLPGDRTVVLWLWRCHRGESD
jgi:hypothetical protein